MVADEAGRDRNQGLRLSATEGSRPLGICQRSTVVVQLIRNQQVMGSNPIVGSPHNSLFSSNLSIEECNVLKKSIYLLRHFSATFWIEPWYRNHPASKKLMPVSFTAEKQNLQYLQNLVERSDGGKTLLASSPSLPRDVSRNRQHFGGPTAFRAGQLRDDRQLVWEVRR